MRRGSGRHRVVDQWRRARWPPFAAAQFAFEFVRHAKGVAIAMQGLAALLSREHGQRAVAEGGNVREIRGHF
jgi:hypothetical protein